MKIKVNGNQIQFEGGSISDLLALCKVSDNGVAVAVGGKVVRRDSLGSHILEDGDVVTIITATYGG